MEHETPTTPAVHYMGQDARRQVFELIEDQLAYDEPDPAELPDDLDVLLALRDKLQQIQAAALEVRKVVDEKIGTTLGAGQKYEYGDSVVSWRHGYRWKPIPESVELFINDVVDPEDVLLLFNVGSIRKTGVEKVASRHDLDPGLVVDSVLEKVWDETPSIQLKPKEM